MLRIPVLLLFGLSFGVTAKPLKSLKSLKSWDELANSAVQKDWLPVDQAMASWAVEPPEDLDQISSDIEPGMKIWKNQKSLKAEKDLDDRQHPSTEELLKAHRDTTEELLKAHRGPGGAGLVAEGDLKVQGRLHLEPEQDLDEVYHAEEVLQKYLAPLVAGYEGAPVVRGVHLEPEPDEDDLYHADVGPALMEPPEVKVQGPRLHLEPEEDLDEVYHRDPETLLSEVRPAAEEAWPVLRRHSEPEEDLDEVYHE